MLRRTWQEFGRRWFVRPQNLVVPPEVQLCVILDDVRELQLPPMVPRWGWFHGTGAVVGEFTACALVPNTRPIVVEWCISTNATAFHAYVGRTNEAFLLTEKSFATGDTGAPLQWEEANVPPQRDTRIFEGSLTPTEFDDSVDQGATGSGSILPSTSMRMPATFAGPWVPVRVLPGQAFYMVGSTTNLALSYTLRWAMYPAPTLDHIVTSARPGA